METRMRLDHIAYRVKDRNEAAHFFEDMLGYKRASELPEGFDVQFEDGTTAKCLVMEPPEETTARIAHGMFNQEWHSPPEIFVSDGSENSIVSQWVEDTGGGIHHLAYEVDSVEETMDEWKKEGIEFTTDKPLTCPGLIQVFTKPHPITGAIYELIEREKQGFCQDNVKDLMNSTKDTNNG